MLISHLKTFFRPNHNRSIQIRRQVLYSFFIKGGSLLINLAIIPLMVDVLDKERYGVWLTLSTIFLWFSNFDIGLGNGLRNKLTEAIANNNKELARIFISTTYALLSIIFLTIAFIFLCVNPFLDWNKILNTSIISTDELFLLTSITFVFFILRFIFQLIGVIYLAIHRPATNNFLIMLGNFISFIVIFILYRYWNINNLVIMGTVLTGIPLIILILANIFAFRGKLKNYSPSFKFIQFRYSKELFVLGGQFFIIQIGAVLLFSTANILITQLFNPEEVVVYNIALQYYNIPIMVYAILLTPLWSAVTDAYTNNDYDWMKKTLRQYNLTSILFVIFIIIMTFCSPFIYKIWLSGKVQVPFTLSIAMSCYAIINILLSPYTSYINGIGKLRLSVLMVSFSIVGYIPFAIIMGKSFGSSIGIVIALCCLNVTGLYFQVKQVNVLLNKRARGIWNK